MHLTIKQVYGSITNRRALLHHYGDRHTEYDDRNLPCPEHLKRNWAYSFQLVIDKYHKDNKKPLEFDEQKLKNAFPNQEAEIEEILRKKEQHLKTDYEIIPTTKVDLECSKQTSLNIILCNKKVFINSDKITNGTIT